MMIPLFLQTLMGYSATDAGMVMAPGGVATLIVMPFVGASLVMIYGEVRRQAGALAFNRIFFIIGLTFLAIIPLLLLLKRPAHQKS